MGYTQDGQIKNFWPDNTPDCLYIHGEVTLDEMLKWAREHFGGRFDPAKLMITPEYIHTRCLTYDLYDSGDYDLFTRIELRNQ